MPYPLTPPPTNDYGAFTIPRILQRWLDVNPIGPLTRTQGYISLPTFSQAVTWQEYSDIVVAFNYEGPNNFTLVGFNVEPFPLPNYCLCIAWKDEYGNMNRYSLWRGVGEVIYLNIPVYSGQKIAKNFRFEIWSTNVATVGQSSPINIYTSVLGGVDYRWGTDFQLVGSDTPCTAFSVGTQPVVSFPTSGLAAHWRADTGISGNSWIDTVSGQILTKGSSPVISSNPLYINNQSYIDCTNGYYLGSNIVGIPITLGATIIIIAAKPSSIIGDILLINDSSASPIARLSISNISTPAYAINTLPINDLATITLPTFRIFQINAAFGSIADLQNNVEISGINLGGESTNNIYTVKVGSTNPAYIAELFIYSGFSSNSEYAQLALYLAQRYVNNSLFALPLIFPSNSSPTVNTI